MPARTPGLLTPRPMAAAVAALAAAALATGRSTKALAWHATEFFMNACGSLPWCCDCQAWTNSWMRSAEHGRVAQLQRLPIFITTCQPEASCTATVNGRPWKPSPSVSKILVNSRLPPNTVTASDCSAAVRKRAVVGKTTPVDPSGRLPRILRTILMRAARSGGVGADGVGAPQSGQCRGVGAGGAGAGGVGAGVGWG